MKPLPKVNVQLPLDIHGWIESEAKAALGGQGVSKGAIIRQKLRSLMPVQRKPATRRKT